MHVIPDQRDINFHTSKGGGGENVHNDILIG